MTNKLAARLEQVTDEMNRVRARADDLNRVEQDILSAVYFWVREGKNPVVWVEPAEAHDPPVRYEGKDIWDAWRTLVRRHG